METPSCETENPRKRKFDDELARSAGEFIADYALKDAFRAFDLSKCSTSTVAYMASRVKPINVPEWFHIDELFIYRWAEQNSMDDTALKAITVHKLKTRVAEYIVSRVEKEPDTWFKSSVVKIEFMDEHPGEPAYLLFRHFAAVIHELKDRGVIAFRAEPLPHYRSKAIWFKKAEITIPCAQEEQIVEREERE